jgi:hypothetical protein
MTTQNACIQSLPYRQKQLRLYVIWIHSLNKNNLRVLISYSGKTLLFISKRHTYFLTCFLTYLFTYSLTYLHTCLLTYSLTCLLTYFLAYLLNTCLITYLLTYLRTYLLTYLLSYLLACLLAYLLYYLLAFVLAYLLAYLPNCLLTYLNTYLLTHSLTPWSRVLLEKLTGVQLVKKFPAFYETRRFITAFTSARHLSLSRASSDPYVTSCLRLIFICLCKYYLFIYCESVRKSDYTHIGSNVLKISKW